jgi:parallel beta-helix repeat protein
MSSRISSGVLLILFVLSSFAFPLRICAVEEFEDIYIRADGSIDPSTVPLATTDNITYVFTRNINASFIIERSNIVIDGDGYALLGRIYHAGFVVWGVDNVTIKNVNIKGFNGGIDLTSSNNCTISGNSITNNSGGLNFFDASGNRIFGNHIASNVDGLDFNAGSHNIIIGNNITANHYDGMWIYGPFNNNVISGNNITHNGRGIRLHFFDNTGPYDNIIVHNNFDQNNNGGVRVDATSKIFHNSLDNGYPSGGNYWGFYNGTDLFCGRYQNETGSDGIGDSPYMIDQNNVDRYPLMQPYNSGLMVTDLNKDGIVDIGDIAVVATAFGAKLGDLKWNSFADLDKNGIVNIVDMAIIAKDYMKTA